MLVVLFHTGGLTGALEALKPVAAMGWSGVGLFLVLSGFSIHFRWAASDLPHHEFGLHRFARRRFFRLYPTYLAAVVVSIAVALVLGSGLDFRVPFAFAEGDTPLLIGLATQVLLVGANITTLPYVGVAWSLGLEAQLYAMYAVLVRRLRTIGVLKIVAWALAITLVFRLGSQVVTTSMPVGQFFPDGHASELSRLFYAQLPARCFEWLLGVLAAEMYFGHVTRPNWLPSAWVALGLLAVSALLFRHPIGAQSLNGHPFMLSDVILDQLLGLTYFVVLLAAIRHENRIIVSRVGKRIIKILGWVGIFSYSLYLLHVPLLGLSASVVGHVGVTGTAMTLAQWVFTLFAAWLFYLVIERHFMDGRVDSWSAAKWDVARHHRQPPAAS